MSTVSFGDVAWIVKELVDNAPAEFTKEQFKHLNDEERQDWSNACDAVDVFFKRFDSLDHFNKSQSQADVSNKYSLTYQKITGGPQTCRKRDRLRYAIQSGETSGRLCEKSQALLEHIPDFRAKRNLVQEAPRLIQADSAHIETVIDRVLSADEKEQSIKAVKLPSWF